MKKICRALDVVICALIAWVLLWSGFEAVAFDDGLYHKLQMQAGILDEAGITEEELKRLDSELAFILDHPNTTTLIGMLERDGEWVSAFNDREMQHIYDCRNLIRGFKDVTWALGALAAVLLLLRILLRRYLPLLPVRWRGFASVWHVWLGFLLPLLPIALLGLWAVIDFQSAFTFFHKLLFTNDLWLLDPATDLLIRICPQSMFMGLGWRIAMQALARLLGFPALLTLLGWINSRRKSKKRLSHEQKL